jgi:hypothetical protein
MIQEKEDDLHKEWSRVLIRDEFLKLYFENLDVNDSLKVERLTDLHEVSKKKNNKNFLFTIVRTSKSSKMMREMDGNDPSSKSDILLNKFIILVYKT